MAVVFDTARGAAGMGGLVDMNLDRYCSMLCVYAVGRPAPTKVFASFLKLITIKINIKTRKSNY